MSKISFELDDTYIDKLKILANNSSIEDKAKEIVINYLNSTNVSNKPSSPKPIDRRMLGI